MNAIESLNLWGDRIVTFAVPMLIQSSLLIVVLFVFDLLLRKRMRAVVRYTLWMLLLVKLLLPPSLALPTGLGYWLGTTQSRSPPPSPSTGVAASYRESPRELLTMYETFTGLKPSPRLKRDGWLLLTWIVGTLSLLGYVAYRNTLVRRQASASKGAPLELNRLLVECCGQVGIRKPIRLAVTEELVSPAVCGLWRAAILLPRQLADRLSALQSRAVLLHELAHVKRGDVWVNYVQTLLQVFYWWHPLLWFANARIRRVREEAVDEAVAVAMGRDAETYPATLLEVAKLALARPVLSLGFIGIMESRSALGERIRLMLLRPWPKSAQLGIKGAFGLLVVAATFLPMSRAEKGEATAKTTLKTNQPDAAMPTYEGKSAEAWFEQMTFDNIARKEYVEAINAFREMGRTAVPFLREMLAPAETPAASRRTGETRKKAAWVLKELGPVAQPVVPELIVALEDEDTVAAYAAMALGAVGPEARSAVPALFESLRFGNGPAAEALAQIAPDDPALVPALIEALQTENSGSGWQSWPPQIHAAKALKKLGTRARAAIPALRKALSATQPSTGAARVDSYAAEALKKIACDDPAVIAGANKTISDIASAHRKQTTDLQQLIQIANNATSADKRRTLGEIGMAVGAARFEGRPVSDQVIREQILPLFAKFLDTSESGDWISVGNGLIALGPFAAPLVPKMLELLEKDDTHARISLVVPLQSIARGDPRTLPLLIRLLDDWSSDLRASACRSLRYFGPEAREAIPALRRRLTDRSPSTRLFAAEVLWRIAQEPPSVQLLQEAIRADEDYAPFLVLETLSEQKRQTKETLALIRELEQHWNPEVRAKAQALLKELGEPANRQTRANSNSP